MALQDVPRDLYIYLLWDARHHSPPRPPRSQSLTPRCTWNENFIKGTLLPVGSAQWVPREGLEGSGKVAVLPITRRA